MKTTSIHRVIACLMATLIGACGGTATDNPVEKKIMLATTSITSCSYVVWKARTNYKVGTIVLYKANGLFYKEVNAGRNGSDGTDPTISTYYWQPTDCNTAPPPPPPPPTTTTCTSTDWTAGINYPVGTVVKYVPNGYFYKEIAAGLNGSDGTNPTISTYYWAPTTCAQTSPPPPSTPAATGRVLGGYWPYWPTSPIRIRDVNPGYNLIYLFAAQPVGGAPGTTGAVYWNAPGDGRGAATNLNADIQYARTVQGRKVILSVGGAGNGMSFPTRTKSQTFVDSISSLYTQFGGIDGIDWNTFEADQVPDTSEMMWISLELKRRYPGFMISAPPAPWNSRDKTFCQTMVQAASIDYCAPQYYDGPGLDDPAYVVSNVNEWVALLGAEHVVVGYGVNSAVNYMTIDEASSSWKQIVANHPTIRGVFNWQIHTDEAQGWVFANTLKPLVNP